MSDLFTRLASPFTNMLSAWQWGLLAVVPPAILLLYFLKLKRQAVEVPSTYLWSRTIEDLHVNSIWQRLRKSLLLLLQLLLIALIMLACLRPGWRGAQLSGNRFIFLIDNSASMSATDVAPNRLEAAKQRALAMIDQMKPRDVAMIVSFSSTARTEQTFSDNHRMLRARVQQIQPTNRSTDISEALRLASGLANPGRSSLNKEGSLDVQVAEALPATLYILSDGGFPPVPNFSPGNLDPQYIPIGTLAPDNVAIISFSTERNSEKPDQLQAFGRLENFGLKDVNAEAALYLNGELLDASKVSVPAQGSAGVQFELEDIEKGVLKLELDQMDVLPLDNVAYTAVNLPRPAKVLFISPGNDALKLALSTDPAQALAEVVFAEPAILEDKEHLDQAATGVYDLIIYDRCVPKQMPQANTLFIGNVPPVEGWKAGEKQSPPGGIAIIDVDRSHPLTQLLEFGNVVIAEGFEVKAPQGGAVLIDAHIGHLFSIAPRQGFEDAALGFVLIGTNDKGERFANTDWTRFYSFPIFVQNVLEYLGGSGGSQAAPSVKPGNPITLRTGSPVEHIRVKSPDGGSAELQREGHSGFVYGTTDTLGVYDVHEGNAQQPAQQFSVNLFDSRESNLAATESIFSDQHNEVKAQKGSESIRNELWKWLLAAGLVVLVFEWYVYNRRVYF